MSKLAMIKKEVNNRVGETVLIIMKEQRGKIEERRGVIDKTYQSFFNVETTGRAKQQLSFNYVDILTNEISIHTEDGLVIQNIPE